RLPRAAALGLVVLLATCGPTAGPTPASGSAPRESASAPAAAAPLTGAAPRQSLRTAYTTAGATMGTLSLAAEPGASTQPGLDAEVVFIAPGQAILGALCGQEAPIVIAGANQVVEANLRGGDYVILGASMPYLTNSIYVHPSVERPDDLRGKSIGVSNFGAIS